MCVRWLLKYCDDCQQKNALETGVILVSSWTQSSVPGQVKMWVCQNKDLTVADIFRGNNKQLSRAVSNMTKTLLEPRKTQKKRWKEGTETIFSITQGGTTPDLRTTGIQLVLPVEFHLWPGLPLQSLLVSPFASLLSQGLEPPWQLSPRIPCIGHRASSGHGFCHCLSGSPLSKMQLWELGHVRLTGSAQPGSSSTTFIRLRLARNSNNRWRLDNVSLTSLFKWLLLTL